MRQTIKTVRVGLSALLLVLLFAALPARADRLEECFEVADPDTVIARCAYLIRREALSRYGEAAVHVRRGQAYEDKGDYVHAFMDYRRAMTHYPPYALSYHYRSRLYIRTGDHERAARDADTAIKLRPKDAVAHDMRALAKAAMGKADEARADAATAATLAGDDAYVNNMRCWTRAILNTDLITALGACDLALRTKYGVALYDSRGFVHFRMGDMTKARADYNAALALNAKNASSLFMRGVARRRSGEAAAGDADIAAALAIDANVQTQYATYGVTP